MTEGATGEHTVPGRLDATQLTGAESLLLTSGDGPWTIAGIERVGLHPIKMTDGSNGARGNRFHGTTSVCFPSGSTIGATWNVDLAHELAEALATESRRKQANVLLGPTINLHRYPLAGRNFESFGEDAFHVGALARAVVRGLQKHGVSAVPKHLVANDSEIERESVDVRVAERALREVYLLPFEMAVRDGGAWAIMSAYNRLNGLACSANTDLLTGILKNEWGFDGVVISDWGGVDSTVGAANAGLDIEMPGPADYFGSHLEDALLNGEVSRDTVVDKANRVLEFARRVGAFDHAPGEEISIDSPVDRELMRRAAREGMVLLRNNGILPLAREKVRRLAVIGPNAAHTAIQGGGSSRVNPAHQVSVLEGIVEAAGAGVEVVHAPGGSISRFAPPLGTSHLTTPDGRPGVLVEYFRSGKLVLSETVASMELTWIGPPLADIPMAEISVRASAVLRVPETGEYRLGLVSAGHAIAHLDGQCLLDSSDSAGGGPHFFGRGSAEIITPVQLEAGRPYHVVVDLETRAEKSATAGVILGMHLPQDPEPIASAVEAAAGADAAVVVVGTSGEYEMEGGDRPTMQLPGQQAELIERVIAANPRTIVLINAGSAVDLAASAGAAAEMIIGFAGQEVGSAVGDVLFGDADPGGRLPYSIPFRLEDGVQLGYEGEGGSGWAGSGGSFTYSDEGRIGYRHHEHTGVPARFPFGHGLSYGHVVFENVEVYALGECAAVELDLVNRSPRIGTAVVEVFARAADSDEPRRLVGFAKHVLEADERLHVRLPLEPRLFRRWSDDTRRWERTASEHQIDVATSAERSVWSGTVEIA